MALRLPFSPASPPALSLLHLPLSTSSGQLLLPSTTLMRAHAQLVISSSTPFPASPSSIMRLPTASDLSDLKTPSLRCTFPALVHADYHIVKEPCDAWIEAVAQPPSSSASLFLQDCLFPLLVCRFIPTAVSRARLVHVIKAISWLMIADDDDDHPDALGSDHATTSHRAGRVMAILRSTREGAMDGSSSFDCSFLPDTRPDFVTKSARMLKALAQLWHEIREEMPPILQARFISTMSDYFEGIKMQASFREQATIPNVESYMEIRRQASFTIPCFVLMEYALGIELDEATFYSPLIQELRNVALDYISLCNDIVSCSIEIRMGDYFNLPFISFNSSMSPQNFTSFQNAMDHVAQMAQDLNNRAIFLISTILEESKNFEPSTMPPIQLYIDGLSLCMSGALAWFYETDRYKQANRRSELQQVAMKETIA